jgi:hypothetical protein
METEPTALAFKAGAGKGLAMDTEARPIWERQPGEPGKWFARFETYRLLGPNRTIDKAYHASGGQPERRANGAWRENARRWNWQVRAEVWDEHARGQVRAREEQRRFDRREVRLHMIDRLLEEVFDALVAADLHALPTSAARAALPILRALFRDLVCVERAELNTPDAGHSAAIISVEDMQRVYRDLVAWRAGGEADGDAADEPDATGDLAAIAMGSARGLPDPCEEREVVTAHALDPAPEVRLEILTARARGQISGLLAQLYPDAASTRRIAALAGLYSEQIAMAAAAVDNWYAVVVEAEHADRLADLVAVVRGEYPGNRRLLEALIGF